MKRTKTNKTKKGRIASAAERRRMKIADAMFAAWAKARRSAQKHASKGAGKSQKTIRLSNDARALLDKVPGDISQFVGNHQLLRSALDYSGKPLAKSVGMKYTLTIVPYQGAELGQGIMVVESKAKPGYSVAPGKWMDFWEPYMRTKHGVSELNYYKLPAERRAQIEADHQISHWLEGEKLDVFPEHFARTYHPVEFEKWMEANKVPCPLSPQFMMPPYGTEKSVQHWRARFLSEARQAEVSSE